MPEGFSGLRPVTFTKPCSSKLFDINLMSQQIGKLVYNKKMKKIIVWILIIIVIIAVVLLIMSSQQKVSSIKAIPTSYRKISYMIEGQATTSYKYFGNEAVGDLNGDGLPDTAFLVTEDYGGSGTFYYVVVALETLNGYQGTNGVLLGDRIAPQTTEINNGELIVNYADRKPSEPMTSEPSVGVSKYLKVQGTTLVEVTK